jgi:hypothetical protein
LQRQKSANKLFAHIDKRKKIVCKLMRSECRKWHLQVLNFKNFLEEYAPRPHGLQPFLPPSNILSHRNMSPSHGKILKKGFGPVYQKNY